MSLITAYIAGSATNPITITAPKTNKVFQRNGSNQSTITITGSAALPFTSIKARAYAMNGGTTTSWSTIYTHAAAAGSFSGSLTVSAGWYRLDIQPFAGSVAQGIASLYPFGVGDVFITCGQSNSANDNQTLLTPSDTRILAANLSDVWVVANDPQPVAQGAAGSIWPPFASHLFALTGYPVGLLSLAIGGTTVDYWTPANASNAYNTLIKPAVQLWGTNGFKAFLWGQGESDNAGGTTAASYESSLQTIISQLRTDAGWTVPVLVATESWINGGASTTIQGAQAWVVANTTTCFAGANTDSLDNSYRTDGTHYNTSGQNAAGNLWYQAVKTAFGW